jgi:hypothetical protein
MPQVSACLRSNRLLSLTEIKRTGWQESANNHETIESGLEIMVQLIHQDESDDVVGPTPKRGMTLRKFIAKLRPRAISSVKMPHVVIDHPGNCNSSNNISG